MSLSDNIFSCDLCEHALSADSVREAVKKLKDKLYTTGDVGWRRLVDDVIEEIFGDKLR